MASPFYLFRKYQRAFIAIAAVVAMFIFVVADPLMTWLQQAGGAGPSRNANTVIASWNGGEIKLQELQRLTERRFKISEFMRNLYGRARNSIEEEGGTPTPPNLPFFMLQTDNIQAVQRGCVITQVFAQKAKDSGISVSDSFINYYLKQWGLGKAGDAEIAGLLSQMRLSDKALFGGLRELLLTHFYTSGYTTAAAGIMPEERWQDWKKINERIVVEVAKIPADDFLSEVPDPDDTQLKQFFEANKDRVSEPYELVGGMPMPSPLPGFRIPRRVKIQYLTANLDDWTQKLLDEVTDEEIAEYYENNKRTQFVKTSSSASSPSSTSIEGLFDDEPTSDNTSDSNTPADDTPNNDESDTSDSEASPAEEPMEENAADSETGPVETPEDSPAGEEASTEETGSEESSVDEPSTNDTSLRRTRSPFRLVAAQTELESAESSAADAEDSENPGSEAESAADSTSENATNENDTDENDTSEDASDYDVVEFEPLDKVSDQIRRVLAEEKAATELEKLIENTTASLEELYTPYGYSVVEARSEGKEIPEPPAKLADYVSIAKETGLISEETALLSQRQLSEAVVGSAIDAKTGSQYVHQAIFGEIGMYEPLQAIDSGRNVYIICKTEDVPSRVPEFDEVRDEVAAAWKQAEAAKLAEAKAEELARAAQESGDRISVVAGAKDYEVVTTDPFSWMSFAGAQPDPRSPPRIAKVPPLEYIDDEFMQAAFDLETDDKVAVTNHNRSTAYVIQLDRREQTEDELRRRFLNDTVNGWFGGQSMATIRFQAAQSLLENELVEELGLNTDALQEMFKSDLQ